jgi:hypothetical protein
VRMIWDVWLRWMSTGSTYDSGASERMLGMCLVEIYRERYINVQSGVRCCDAGVV